MIFELTIGCGLIAATYYTSNLKNSAVSDEEWLVPISTSHKRYRMVKAVSYQYEQGFSVTDVIFMHYIIRSSLLVQYWV